MRADTVKSSRPSPHGALPTRAQRTHSVGDAPRIGFLYSSGWGNLGDDAIHVSFINAVRQRWPRAHICGFTLNPPRTAALHDIEAAPITGVSLRRYPIDLGEDEPLPVWFVRRVAWRLESLKVPQRALRWVESATAIAVFERRSLWHAWRWLQTADLLIVPGGGHLTDIWGGTWGGPYALARWAWLSQWAGVPFVLWSVGFGEVHAALSRTFLRYALNHARYCSVRDDGSRDLAAGLRVRTQLRRAPDLAFGLRKAPGEPNAAGPPVIGISPMAFLHRYWPRSDPHTYTALVKRWATLVSDRVARGDHVVLYTTDPSDEAAVDDVWSRLDDAARSGCTRERPSSVSEVLTLYASFHLVVASRLHGVLLALVAERPVVALAYERKVRAVMDAAGRHDQCFAILDWAPPQVTETVNTQLAHHPQISGEIARVVAAWRFEVDRQADDLASFLRGSGRP